MGEAKNIYFTCLKFVFFEKPSVKLCHKQRGAPLCLFSLFVTHSNIEIN